MKVFVLDASVAVKWMLPAKDEPLRPQAYRLLDAYGASELNLIVPDIFWPECGNVLWKAIRQGRFDRTAAEDAIEWLTERNLRTISSVSLLDEAMAVALDFDRTVYDALYVALAAQTKNHLITADEHLANALAARFPVKWLGAF